jgi:hypothetical protein
MNVRRHLTCLSILVAGAATMPSATAASLDRASASDLVRKAELIFLGSVLSVDYRNSDVEGPQHALLPHTFVTFRIDHAFKGRSEAGDVITLRFQGGPDGRGRILTIPGVPLFEVNDRDLLFVQANGEAICPLVGWFQGRTRIIDRLAYTDDGREVWRSQDGGFAFGRQHALPEIVTKRIGDMEFQAVLNQAPDTMVAAAPGAERLDESSLTAAVERLVRASAGARATSRPAASAQVSEKFYVTAPVAGPPPAAPPAER